MPVHTYVINVYNNEPLIKNCKTETTWRWISFCTTKSMSVKLALSQKGFAHI